MSEELNRSMGRMEGKLDEVLKNQCDFRAKFDKHDDRLRHLEGQNMKFLGVIAVFTVALNVLWQSFKTRLGF